MIRKPVIPRQSAEQDTEAAIGHYQHKGGSDLTLRFIDSLEQAYAQLSKNPGIGSPRYATELDFPGLRTWPLNDFPYLIFYIELPSHLDIWRLLHGMRDIPVWALVTSFEPIIRLMRTDRQVVLAVRSV